MITRDELNLMEDSLRALCNAAETFDEAISSPFYEVKQALYAAVNRARVDFITRPVKTSQIAELPVCPLCEERTATVGMSDHLFTVLMTYEEGVERDDPICKNCHEKWSVDYPEESPATINDRRGWFPKWEHDERRVTFSNEGKYETGYTMDGPASDYDQITDIPF